MRVYLAAPYAARDFVSEQAGLMSAMGHECTSLWALGRETVPVGAGTVGATSAYSTQEVAAHAAGDFDDIDRADALIVLTGAYVAGVLPDIPIGWLHTGGRHVEVGYALAKGKPVAVVGPLENVFQRGLCLHAQTPLEALRLLS